MKITTTKLHFTPYTINIEIENQGDIDNFRRLLAFAQDHATSPIINLTARKILVGLSP